MKWRFSSSEALCRTNNRRFGKGKAADSMTHVRVKYNTTLTCKISIKRAEKGNRVRNITKESPWSCIDEA